MEFLDGSCKTCLVMVCDSLKSLKMYLESKVKPCSRLVYSQGISGYYAPVFECNSNDIYFYIVTLLLEPVEFLHLSEVQ